MLDIDCWKEELLYTCNRSALFRQLTAREKRIRPVLLDSHLLNLTLLFQVYKKDKKNSYKFRREVADI
jgi:hypothetical protein